MILPAVIAAILACSTPPDPSAPHPAEDEPRAAVEAFLRNDFEGAGLRGDLIWTPDHETVFDPVWDPVIIVASPCSIDRVEANRTRATAHVSCSRIAARNAAGADFKLDRRSERFVIRVEERGGRWAVVDPPTPRVPLPVVLRAHENDALPAKNDAWQRGASDAQRRELARIQRAEAFLRDLAKP
jgi:hypothetical protein